MIEKFLELMDEAYSKYLAGDITQKDCINRLQVALNGFPFEMGKKEFTIQITTSKNGNEPFFGMRVFPDIEELDDFCKDVINDDLNNKLKFMDIIKKWKKIDKWFLEIDGICFDRTEFNFTPKELTALTLHEIGHIIYSDKPIESFYRAYKDITTRMKATDKATQKLMYDIYMIPLAIACMQRRWIDDKNQVQLEIIADKSVVELGYGEYLVEALEKIYRKMGSINSQNSLQQAEVSTTMKWCQSNIIDIMKRKEQLKDELYYRAIRTKSNYVKAMSIIILDKLGFKLRERYTGYVVENSIELLNDPKLMEKYKPIVDALESAKFNKRLELLQSNDSIAMEGLFNRRKKIKVELPSQYEIDKIAVEVDKITNNHDRIFVLDLIYEVLDRINSFEEAIAPDPNLNKKWSGKISTMKTEIETLRQAVLAKKTFSSSYKFFVKLPDEASDYEG